MISCPTGCGCDLNAGGVSVNVNADVTARVSSVGSLRGSGGRGGLGGGMGMGEEVRGYRRLTRAKRIGMTLDCQAKRRKRRRIRGKEEENHYQPHGWSTMQHGANRTL